MNDLNEAPLEPWRPLEPCSKDLNEATLEPWGQLEAIPLHTLHIDHKGPLLPLSKGNRFCLVIVDAFSRFIQVYPSKNAEALETVNQIEKFITAFGIRQQIVHENGNAFISNDFVHYTNKMGITLCPPKCIFTGD